MVRRTVRTPLNTPMVAKNVREGEAAGEALLRVRSTDRQNRSMEGQPGATNDRRLLLGEEDGVAVLGAHRMCEGDPSLKGG